VDLAERLQLQVVQRPLGVRRQAQPDRQAADAVGRHAVQRRPGHLEERLPHPRQQQETVGPRPREPEAQRVDEHDP
jgi:hypothetical protein